MRRSGLASTEREQIRQNGLVEEVASVDEDNILPASMGGFDGGKDRSGVDGKVVDHIGYRLVKRRSKTRFSSCIGFLGHRLELVKRAYRCKPRRREHPIQQQHCRKQLELSRAWSSRR